MSSKDKTPEKIAATVRFCPTFFFHVGSSCTERFNSLFLLVRQELRQSLLLDLYGSGCKRHEVPFLQRSHSLSMLPFSYIFLLREIRCDQFRPCLSFQPFFEANGCELVDFSFLPFKELRNKFCSLLFQVSGFAFGMRLLSVTLLYPPWTCCSDFFI